jgi:hypothetical protein
MADDVDPATLRRFLMLRELAKNLSTPALRSLVAV